MNCTSPFKAMARKTKQSKFIKDVRVPEKAAIRRQASKPTGLYLLELRTHVAKVQSPKGKNLIQVNVNETPVLKAKPARPAKA
jgi:hypothetical protein